MCNPLTIAVTSIIRKQTIYLKQQLLTLTFGEFIYYPLCKDVALSYSATLNGSEPLPSFIEFNPLFRIFKIDAFKVDSPGRYTIKVTGSAGAIKG